MKILFIGPPSLENHPLGGAEFKRASSEQGFEITTSAEIKAYLQEYRGRRGFYGDPYMFSPDYDPEAPELPQIVPGQSERLRSVLKRADRFVVCVDAVRTCYMPLLLEALGVENGRADCLVHVFRERHEADYSRPVAEKTLSHAPFLRDGYDTGAYSHMYGRDATEAARRFFALVDVHDEIHYGTKYEIHAARHVARNVACLDVGSLQTLFWMRRQERGSTTRFRSEGEHPFKRGAGVLAWRAFLGSSHLLVRRPQRDTDGGIRLLLSDDAKSMLASLPEKAEDPDFAARFLSWCEMGRDAAMPDIDAYRTAFSRVLAAYNRRDPSVRIAA